MHVERTMQTRLRELLNEAASQWRETGARYHAQGDETGRRTCLVYASVYEWCARYLSAPNVGEAIRAHVNGTAIVCASNEHAPVCLVAVHAVEVDGRGAGETRTLECLCKCAKSACDAALEVIARAAA